ncbi:TetR/AcrR family transcriptional regulator [Actinacidiphila guanduensis]|uniref:Transcriptional regulator, TetR family n=1 Tax=Actinacidiphila guanduensis TaxID=310781 RepID=A0A1G9VPC4_9ACTN|nr:TetR/AcrR family transcriptional regulator [Actinacidiphila guanduensis]SDM73923.1 transcriptional regulator, TetR family [Actinacidiphila guanduensis]
MATQETRQRPMRRDAARNQQLVLAAAREVLSEHGTDASMEQIASRAGVGVGTLYRRFPNKEALVEEIAAQVLGELVGEARRALQAPDGTGLETYIQVLGQWLVEYRGYADKLVGATKAACVEILRDLTGQLLRQGQQAGRIAPEIELGDVQALVWGLRGVVEVSGEVAPDAWRRFAAVQLAGMRAPGSLEGLPPVGSKELAEITAGAHKAHRAAQQQPGRRAGDCR